MSTPNMAHVRAPIPDNAPTQDRPKGWVDLPVGGGSFVSTHIDRIDRVQDPHCTTNQCWVVIRGEFYTINLGRLSVLSLIAKAQQS